MPVECSGIPTLAGPVCYTLLRWESLYPELTDKLNWQAGPQ